MFTTATVHLDAKRCSLSLKDRYGNISKDVLDHVVALLLSQEWAKRATVSDDGETIKIELVNALNGGIEDAEAIMEDRVFDTIGIDYISLVEMVTLDHSWRYQPPLVAIETPQAIPVHA